MSPIRTALKRSLAGRVNKSAAKLAAAERAGWNHSAAIQTTSPPINIAMVAKNGP